MSNCRDYYILDDDLGGLGRAMCTVPMCLVGCHQPSEQQGRLRRCLQASFWGMIHLFVSRKDCSTFFYFLRQKRHLLQIMHHWNWNHVELVKNWESDILECVQAPFNIKPDRTYVEFRDVSRENMVLFNLIFLNPLLSCFTPPIENALTHQVLSYTPPYNYSSPCSFPFVCEFRTGLWQQNLRWLNSADALWTLNLNNVKKHLFSQL